MTLHQIIREAIEDAVARNGGNKVDAAKELGIGKTTVYRWMAAYGRRKKKVRKKTAKRRARKSKSRSRRR